MNYKALKSFKDIIDMLNITIEHYKIENATLQKENAILKQKLIKLS
jgi:hypothetical protein